MENIEMATITDYETEQIKKANATGKTPVVFIHGLWLSPSNREVGAQAGRGWPLLRRSGEEDHTVPWAIANASFKKQDHNEGMTEIVKIPNRGHSLTIDSGWREVGDIALDFVKRFA
jgi:hypothetical protein